jgi:hypothetical protein
MIKESQAKVQSLVETIHRADDEVNNQTPFGENLDCINKQRKPQSLFDVN